MKSKVSKLERCGNVAAEERVIEWFEAVFDSTDCKCVLGVQERMCFVVGSTTGLENRAEVMGVIAIEEAFYRPQWLKTKRSCLSEYEFVDEKSYFRWEGKKIDEAFAMFAMFVIRPSKKEDVGQQEMQALFSH